MAPSSTSISRAVQGGLVLGLLGASLVLLYGCWRTSNAECEYPGTEECVFEQGTHQEIARLQAYAAIGCALVSGGLYLFLRRTP